MQAFGHYAFVWRRRIVAAAALFAVVAGLVGSEVFDRVEPFGFADPDSESERATRLLEDATGSRPVAGVVLLVKPKAGLVQGAARVATIERRLAAVRGISAVAGPQETGLISSDGTTGLITGWLATSATEPADVGERVQSEFRGASDVEAGGPAVAAAQLDQATVDDLRRIELIVFPLLFFCSLFAFRGLIAALIPIGVGALSIASTLFVMRLLTELTEIDSFAINIVTALGLGLAIDYSLFMLASYRDELERHGPTGAALRATTASIGRMVAFSGLTVAAALASLCVFPQRFLYSIGLGGAIVAIVSAIVVITVLPSVLALLGHRVNSLVPAGLDGKPSGKRWYAWALTVTRYPVPFAVAAAAIMLAAGLPFLRVDLTRADASALPLSASANSVQRSIVNDFPRDPSARIVVVVEPGGRAAGAAQELRRTTGISVVSEPVAAGRRLLRVDAGLTVGAYDETAVAAVERARNLNWGAPVLVTGPTADLIDQRASIVGHLPLLLLIVSITTVGVLFAMTRSVLLPLIALLMNALTVSVAFGTLVMIFADGNFAGLLGFEAQGALDISMPILLFAVAFGLSTDYGVFLLQRIGEARRSGGSERAAIARGLAASGRTITSAAILFAIAFGSFTFSELIFVKELALGAAVAVLVDATLVRAVLFPALLRLAGKRAWWSPLRPRSGERPRQDDPLAFQPGRRR